MNIPEDAVIPSEKLTRYLLVARNKSDKSRLLARAGFTLANPHELARAIRVLNTQVAAVQTTANDYGDFYRVNGELAGVNGVNLNVSTVWLKRKVDDTFW